MPESPRLPEPQRSTTTDDFELRELFATLWRHAWLIAACTVVALGVAGLAIVFQRPVYETTALVRIVPEEKGFGLGTGSSNSMSLLLGLDDSGDLYTAMGIFESRRIAEAIVDSLAMHVELRRPHAPRDRVLRILEAPRTTRSARVDLRYVGDNAYSASVSGLPGSILERVEIGSPAALGGLVFVLEPELRVAPPERISLRVRPYQQTIRRLQDRLAVTQPTAGSELIRLVYRNTDSILVAEVLNLATSRFVEYHNLTTSSESHSVLGFLQQQGNRYQQDLRAAEERLQRFLETAQIVEPKTEAEMQARRLAEIQADREEVASERETLAALLERIEQTPRSPNDPSPYRQLVAFPSFLANSMVQYILQSIIALENSRAELLVRRLDRDPDVIGQTQRIHELEEQLHQIARNYLNDRDRRLAAFDAALGRFGGEVAAFPAREVELRRLTRETELLEEVYQMIETKLKEEEIRGAAQLANIQIVDDAVVPDRPEFPKPWLYLLGGALLGMFVGAGAAVVRTAANPTVDTPDHVVSSTAGLPVLASIRVPRAVSAPLRNGRPALHSGRHAQRAAARALPVPARPGGEAAGRTSSGLVAGTSNGPLADAYRSLRTNVMAGVFGDTVEPEVLVITGVEAGDDAAFTAAHLAVALAQQGSRVVLLDGDLRDSKLHTLLGAAQQPGLVEALATPGVLEDVLQEVSTGADALPLRLLASGTPRQNPADVLGAQSMRLLIERLRRDHDQVVILAPALSAAPEAPLLARLADRAILVVTTGSTGRPALGAATRQLQRLRVPVEGVVMHARG